MSSFELTHLYSELYSTLLAPKSILFQPLFPDYKNIHLSLETDSECIPATSQHHHQVKEQMLRLHWHFPVIKGLSFYWIQLSRKLEETTEQLYTTQIQQLTLSVQLIYVHRLMIKMLTYWLLPHFSADTFCKGPLNCPITFNISFNISLPEIIPGFNCFSPKNSHIWKSSELSVMAK